MQFLGGAMRVVCVHGIGQQLLGERELLMSWVPSLHDGVTRAGFGDLLRDDDIGMAFYGDLFRPAGQRLAAADPPYQPKDVAPGLEQELLLAWWQEAARVDPGVVAPDADTLVRTPRSTQAAFRALSRSRFFGGLALRAMIADLKQVRRYLTDPVVRAAARGRVRALLGPDTRVVVGHSLGSVIAYEALCAVPAEESPALALVTLGSPLGIRNLIFERLDPAPADGVGRWPGAEGLVWTNIADAGDVVALEKDLRPWFGDRVNGFTVYNGAHAHDVRPYLSDATTGNAIAEGLARP
ncbi:hypothetical protein GCM10027451_27850 [Geodermatophilus aquaeductus]|uniref:Alpha/beta hydrolase n=1 Tax=Geodermatophilus aquaeductus TaxID=1564161 RepID=A0A521F869_9ACTN|nr:hypothetical protein [Geodermatophilus aquaeductus]SMO92347.1 hypothetical protein SAMN06273567_107174 [Geodermatophilus aquaeductus]